MKLCQGQVWKSGKEYIRIVKLERLASKKDFCRLLKQARLLAPD
jgi:hypothetical protein